MIGREFRSGDVAACFGTDGISRTISIATASLLAPHRLRIAPSHVAIICEYCGAPTWVESTTLCRHPCRITETHTSGMQAHYPEDRIDDYTRHGGRVDLYRLSAIDSLTTTESSLLTKILIHHFLADRVSYDTPGAIISGTRLFKYTRLLPRADLHQLFCSELIAATLQRLNRMNRANPTRFNPGSLCRTLVRQGTYSYERSYHGIS